MSPSPEADHKLMSAVTPPAGEVSSFNIQFTTFFLKIPIPFYTCKLADFTSHVICERDQLDRAETDSEGVCGCNVEMFMTSLSLPAAVLYVQNTIVYRIIFSLSTLSAKSCSYVTNIGL